MAGTNEADAPTEISVSDRDEETDGSAPDAERSNDDRSRADADRSGRGSSADAGGSATGTHDAIADILDDRDLVVVSNRQPYSHEYDDGDVVVTPPAGGLTAALDPLLQELSGRWVAWGSGDADRAVVDEDDTVSLPPGDDAYDLRRVWLDDDEVDGYYRGFSNRVLWPVCHSDPSKIDLRPGDWETYRAVNERFADAVVEQAPTDAIVWFQDYHFALAPQTVRAARPDVFLAHFWHIPWPPADVFQACPHGEQVLGGLLANDLVGFHTDADARNFLDCVEAAGIGRVDRPSGSVQFGGVRTYVRSFPIGIDADQWVQRADSEEAAEFRESFRDEHDLAGRRVAVGVERLDYTKGIEQRLDALATLWADRPDLRGDLTYVQKVSISRSEIPAYRRLRTRVEDRVAELNDRFGTGDWQPIVYTTEHLSREALAGLYREADVALVTPVRDGMNLVAKEFAASQGEDPGVLLLSELAGASEQLGDGSLLVNPYDVQGTADAIADALEIPAEERERRMARLQAEVTETDIYAWLSDQFRTFDRIRARPESADELLP